MQLAPRSVLEFAKKFAMGEVTFLYEHQNVLTFHMSTAVNGATFDMTSE